MNAPATMDELQAQMKALGKAVKAQKPPKPKHLGKPAASLSVPEAREHLRTLRDGLLQKASGGVWMDGESREWARVSHEHRMMVMMLAGISGDLDALAARAWREFTPAERAAVKGEMRAAKRTFSAVAALCSRL
ncbi:hypothetical protein [Comamonas jiangduensis]|uniref:Uncharacterized protein n=1 Tax=Comamonas jiangduensis TaxID=1194168 RepID=A0ABV4IBA6_9BURK